MKKILTWATPVASLAVVFAVVYSTQAQPPGAQPQASPAVNAQRFKIAVVDISRIFNEHQGFKDQIAMVKKEVEQVEVGLKQDQTQLRSMVEQLKQFNPGTPDFKKLDEDIAKKKAEVQLRMEKHRKDFMEKEARIYDQTFLAVSGAVKQYSLHNDLALVVQQRTDKAGPQRAAHQQLVMRKLQNPIVFQNKIDITDDILTMLNTRRAAARPRGTQPAPRR